MTPKSDPTTNSNLIASYVLPHLICDQRVGLHYWRKRLLALVVFVSVFNFTSTSFANSMRVDPLKINSSTDLSTYSLLPASVLLVDEIPTILVRFANPQYDCTLEEYCLDVEFQSDLEDQELFGMNVRFFYEDNELELIDFRDFQGGYGPVAPNPPSVLTSGLNFGYDFFGFGSSGDGAADWVSGAIQLVQPTEPQIILSTTEWTKLFQICFAIEETEYDSISYCPPIVWDLRVDPMDGGFLSGDDGVVITVVNDPPAESGPANRGVEQFNWEYSGNGVNPPFGQPVELNCTSISCPISMACPPDITIDCEESTLPANTGLATAEDFCPGPPLISFTDSFSTATCVAELLIFRTWIATDSCANLSTCVQVITVEQRGMICGAILNDLDEVIGNVELRLFADINENQTIDAGDTLVAITFSDAVSGLYCFDGVPPCTYVIQETQPLYHGDLFDYDFSPDPDGMDSLDGPDNEIPVNLMPCEVDSNNNFIDIVCPIDFPVVPADTLCEDGMVDFIIEDLNIGLVTYSWDFGSGSTPSSGTGLGLHTISYITTTDNQENGAQVELTLGKSGCPDTTAVVSVIEVYPYADATIDTDTDAGCYYTERTFQPLADEIPGATYNWDFGVGASPATGSGYGPHSVIYQSAGSKSVSLAIYPNAPGAQCPDSSMVTFNIINCPANIVGAVKSTTDQPISQVNIRLFADDDFDGIADNNVAIRSVFTNAQGNYSMAQVTPGNYVIVQIQPATWNSFDDGDPTPDNDIVDNIDSLDNLIPATLTPLEVDQLNLFIEIAIAGQISGSVFVDTDNDQVPDEGEGLANVTLSLYHDVDMDGVADDNTPIETQLSSSDGSYIFPDVAVGNYVLVETQPIGYSSIIDIDVSNDGDNVPNTNTLNDTIPVTINNGEVDAGNYFIEADSCGLIVMNANDSGPGSLRRAIDCAEPGDTISFSASLAGATIFINSARLLLEKDIVIYSTISPRVNLYSQISGFFEIVASYTVEFHNLNIVSGLSGNDGAAFRNDGILKLEDVNVLRNPALPPENYLIFNTPSSELIIRGNCLLEFD